MDLEWVLLGISGISLVAGAKYSIKKFSEILDSQDCINNQYLFFKADSEISLNKIKFQNRRTYFPKNKYLNIQNN